MNQQETSNTITESVARVELSIDLRNWLLAKDKAGITRKNLLRITTLEAVTGDSGGNLRRWLADGNNGIGKTVYVPTLKTLQGLAGYLEQYGYAQRP